MEYLSLNKQIMVIDEYNIRFYNYCNRSERMPPKKPEPVKKDTKKDGKKKDDKKEEEIVEPVREERYQEKPENIKSSLEHYKQLLGGRSGLDVHGVVETVLEGIVQEKSGRVEKVKREIDQKQIRDIFKNLREGKGRVRSDKDEKVEKIEGKLELQFKKLSVFSEVSSYPEVAKFQYHSNLAPQELQRLLHLVKFQELLNSKQRYRRFDLRDRNITETIPPQRLCEILNKYLSNNCQYFTARLNNNSQQLIALYYQNPPGRNIYYTDSTKLKQGGRFDYWEEEMMQKGGVAIRTRFMFPADNALLVEKIRKVGEEVRKEVKVMRSEGEFSVKKNGKRGGEFWGTVKGVEVKVKKVPKYEVKEEVVVQDVVVEEKVEEPPVKEILKGSPKKAETKKPDPKSVKKGQKQKIPEPQPQPIAEPPAPVQPPPPQKPIQYTQSVSLSSTNFTYTISTYISISPKSLTSSQTHRQYGPNGEVIRHCKDKSVSILYPNGDTATFKSNSWSRIVNNKLILDPESSKDLKTKHIPNESSNILIRQDSTIFIEQQNIKTIIYPDQTQYKTDLSNHTVTIHHHQYPTIRIRHDPHRIKSQNIIGKGTSYAYLGYENLFERSYNGHIFELFEQEFSYFRYSEKVLEHELEEPKETEISLIHFREGSILKMEMKELLFVASEDLDQLSLVNPNEHWLQLFTTPQHRKQGIYVINLEQPTITTTDNQGNYFQLNPTKPSITRTAVSLNIDNKEYQQPKYQNGYYVDQENYFLPTPLNFIHPRLFVVEGGIVKEYLNDEMANHEWNIAVKYGHQIVREAISGGKQHILVYKNRAKDEELESIIPPHTLKLTQSNSIPKVLKDYTSTYITPHIPDLPRHQSRSFIRQNVLDSYHDYLEMIESYNKQVQMMDERREKSYRVLTRGDLV